MLISSDNNGCLKAPQEQYALLQDKYNRMQDQFSVLLKSNQELEDRLLSCVDKTEYDKLKLSHEIDELTLKLRAANLTISNLQSECARYKSDCVLAVHLLQCQPSNYVARKLKSAPLSSVDQLCNGGLTDKMSAENSQNKRMVNVSSFPPTALVFDNEAPEDPMLKDSTSACTAANSVESSANDSLTDLFVGKILAEPNYSGVLVSQCKSCGKSIQRADKDTQTSMVDLICLEEECEAVGLTPFVHLAGKTNKCHSDARRHDSVGSNASSDTVY